jgi:MoaA/NifB/PqqE/SkfB family radical SAM enzyme
VANCRPETWRPRLIVGRIDVNEATGPLTDAILTQIPVMPPPAFETARSWNHCRFAHEGMLAVAWDGRVAPCLSLLHTHPEHVNSQVRTIYAHTVGSVDERPLAEIWREPAFRAFRRRVRDFDFPFCFSCGSCPMTETNQEDCYGSPFPTCGLCLWAQGIVLCP